MLIKKLIIILVTAILIIGMCACGAEVNTELSVNQDSSGYRFITCTIDNRELDNFVFGGINGLELLIRQNIPSGMTYEITENDKQTIVRFTIDFSSFADYRQKITSILKRQSASVIVVCENIFNKGICINEDFTSKDLLGWMTDALVAAGMFESGESVSVNDKGSVLNIARKGADKLNIQTEANIKYIDIVDNGADSIDISTNINDDGSAARTIRAVFSAEKVAAIGRENILKYFGDAGASAVKADDDNGNEVFTIVLKGKDAGSIYKKTAKLLGGDNVAKTHEYLPAFNMNTAINESLDLSSILSVNNPQCRYSMILPGNQSAVLNASSSDGLSLTQTGEGKMEIAGNIGLQPVISYTYAEKAAFDRINILTDLSVKNHFTRTVEFYIPDEQLALYGNTYDKLLTGIKLDDVDISSVDNSNAAFRIYKWEYDARSRQEFSDMNNRLFKNSEDFVFSRENNGNGSFYHLNDNMNLKKLLTDMGDPVINYTLKLPKKATVENQDSGKKDVNLSLDEDTGLYCGTITGSRCNVIADISMNNRWIIVLIITGGLVSVLAVIIIVFRNKKKVKQSV